MLRPPPPSINQFNTKPICLPQLACGTDVGSECCDDGPACFGTDGFGNPLTCVEGSCVRCGLRGTPPCDGAPPLLDLFLPTFFFLLERTLDNKCDN
jgi:hypothetical protein